MTTLILPPAKGTILALITGLLLSAAPLTSFAENTDPPHNEGISGKSVLAGLTSLIIWPGIGQAINSTKGKKVAAHAIIGLLPPFRLWSGYDALVDRHGGYWDGKI